MHPHELANNTYTTIREHEHVSNPMRTTQSVMLGGYSLVRPIGQGGSARVWLAEHPKFRFPVALKVPVTSQIEELDESYVRFSAEAQAMQNLKHPHIVRMLEFGIDRKIPYLAMNYARGGSISQVYPAGKVMPEDEVMRYVRQIADALHYMHEQGWIHRDVKPGNLLLRRPGHLLLADMGIALTRRQASSVQRHTRQGTVMYMAPELLRGVPSPASDQYALAVVAYEWLSGLTPFQGTKKELVYQHLHADVPPLWQQGAIYSPLVDQVLQRALAKNPAERYPDIHAFAQALTQSLSITQTSSYSYGRRQQILTGNLMDECAENYGALPRHTEALVADKHTPLKRRTSRHLQSHRREDSIQPEKNAEQPSFWNRLFSRA